jgi:hypothetical protein
MREHFYHCSDWDDTQGSTIVGCVRKQGNNEENLTEQAFLYGYVEIEVQLKSETVVGALQLRLIVKNNSGLVVC